MRLRTEPVLGVRPTHILPKECDKCLDLLRDIALLEREAYELTLEVGVIRRRILLKQAEIALVDDTRDLRYGIQ